MDKKRENERASEATKIMLKYCDRDLEMVTSRLRGLWSCYHRLMHLDRSRVWPDGALQHHAEDTNAIPSRSHVSAFFFQ